MRQRAAIAAILALSLILASCAQQPERQASRAKSIDMLIETAVFGTANESTQAAAELRSRASEAWPRIAERLSKEPRRSSEGGERAKLILLDVLLSASGAQRNLSEEVSALVGVAVEDESPEVREKASLLLLARNESWEQEAESYLSSFPLTEFMPDADEKTETIWRAEELLLKRGNKRAEEFLVGRIAGGTMKDRERAVRAIISANRKELLPYAEGLLNSDNAALRAAAARAVGALGSEKNAQAVLSMLNDTSPEVRGEAARAYASLLANNSLPELAGALKRETEPQAKKAITDAMREANNTRA